ncbi:MAG: phage minor tail protein L [Alteromonadaceae bacterium]|nr:MAG: phage minor tail protein L [Alteromonadaceae bacterium]
MPDIIASTAQQSNYGALVSLFVIDASAIEQSNSSIAEEESNNSTEEEESNSSTAEEESNSSEEKFILRFTPGPFNQEAVLFDGQPYAPLPCELTGLIKSSAGAIPSPSFKVSNIAGQFVTAALGLDNLVGATITLIRTFDRFLDTGENPDPLAKFPDEIFIIDQMSSMDKVQIVWQLAAFNDRRGTKLPRRNILRNACTHRYRRHSSVSGEFDYKKVTCPYTETESYDLQNQLTTPSDDRCSKNLAACKVRFGENASLPFRGFPGVARMRERG